MSSDYADRIRGVSTSVAIKAPCRAATTANITLSGLKTIDGVSLVAGDRVLVKNQTNGVNNGIWIVSADAWTRAIDMNGARDLVQGTEVYIVSGTLNGDIRFAQTAASPVVGQTSQTWAKISRATDQAEAAADAAEAAAAALGHLLPMPSGGDDAPTIIAALTSANGEKVIGQVGATYRLLSSVTYAGPVNLDLSQSKWEVGANVNGWILSPVYPAIYALTSNYTPGSTTLAVATMASAARAGDVVTIISEALDPGNRDEGSNAEKYRVVEQAVVAEGSTTTSLKLSAPLRFVEGVSPTSTGGDEAYIASYTTAMNASALVMPGDTVFNADFGPGGFEAGHPTWTAIAIILRGYVRPKIKAQINKSYSGGVYLSGCFEADADITGIDLVDDTANGHFGYMLADRSAGTRAYLRGNNVRHIYSTLAASFAWADISAVNILSAVRAIGSMVQGHASGMSDSAFETHSDAQDVTFLNPRVFGSTYTAVSFRGRNISAVAPVINGPRTAFRAFTEESPGDPNDDLYVNGTRQIDWTSGQVIGGTCDVTGLVFNNVAATLFAYGGEFRTSGREAIRSTGILRLRGTMTITFTGDPADTSAADIFDLDEDTGKALTVFPERGIWIDGDVTVDWRTASATNLRGIYSSNSSVNKLHVTGKLTMLLPSGATRYSSLTLFDITGDGQVVFDVGGTITKLTAGGIELPSYTLAGVPSAATAGRLIYVSNESGGAVPAFSDGTNWRRVTDRVVVS